MASPPEVKRRILAAFDFDHTLVELNTDAEVQRLSPGGKLPEEPFKNLRQSLNWQEYMQKVFDHLHQNKVGLKSGFFFDHFCENSRRKKLSKSKNSRPFGG